MFSVLVFGPILSALSVSGYFASSETWGYLSTALLVIRRGLPGVFSDNPYPFAVNGSLWTLPVEFLCYVSVAMVGSIYPVWRNWSMALSLGLVVLAAAFGSLLLGARFISHFEMVAFFWWGVMYGFLRNQPGPNFKHLMVVVGVALTAFLLLGSRGIERTGTLVLAAALIAVAQRVSWGAWVTDRLGDLSYGMYIFAFPVQQMVAQLGTPRGWGFATHLCLSFGVTSVLAYLSWHLLEKRVLIFKPKRPVLV
jgi:peptidoglycan/LPS O-acetylase OafA/YrhL